MPDVTFALFALKAKGEPQRVLVRDAETLRQRLLHVPGVKKVNIVGRAVGAHLRRVCARPAGHAGHRPPQEVFAALNSQNVLTPCRVGGNQGARKCSFALDGAFDTLQKIRDTPLVAQGRTLKLSDVATGQARLRRPGHLHDPQRRRACACCSAWSCGKAGTGSTWARRWTCEARAINAELPLGLSLTKVTDQAVNISASVDEFMVKFFVGAAGRHAGELSEHGLARRPCGGRGGAADAGRGLRGDGRDRQELRPHHARAH